MKEQRRIPTDEKPPVQDGGDLEKQSCEIKALGTGDLYKVEQETVCYKPGEVAHIENILAGEARERVHRRLRRTEESFTEEVERIVDEERNLQTTDRYEMENATQQTITQNMALDVGMSVSGDFGMVQVGTTLGFSMSNSSTESQQSATSFSQEVVESTRKRVSERIRSSRTYTVIEEYEETNTHSIKNTVDGVGNGEPITNRAGIYRWIDKYMRARVMNYGTRTFIQFTVPEPAAYHILNKVTAPAVENLIMPYHPSKLNEDVLNALGPINSFQDITEANYAALSAYYDCTDILPPPPSTISVVKGKVENVGTVEAFTVISGILDGFEIEDGYDVQSININGYVVSGSALRLTMGQSIFIDVDGGGSGEHFWEGPFSTPFAMDNYVFDYSLSVNNYANVNFHVLLNCSRTSRKLDDWKIKTYASIMAAYQRKQADYEARLKAAKADLMYIKGDNPGVNRQTEARELKRCCIEMLYGVRDRLNLVTQRKWASYGSVNESGLGCSLSPEPQYPFIDPCEANLQVADVLFFEQAFDWRNITYVYYPYYWARKCRWDMLYDLDDTDPLFTKFLQSGMARVVVPLRPGFESSVFNYLKTGRVWNGAGLPAIGDPLYVDILTELQEAASMPQQGIEIASWEYKLPTNLVLLQNDATPVDGEGLPCDHENGIDGVPDIG